MRIRTQTISEYLEKNEHILMIPHFPLMGKGDFAVEMGPLHGPITDSQYLPESVISPFPRFA